MSNLKHLDLGSNGLSGDVAEIYRLTLLEYLDLSWQSNNFGNCTSSDGRVVEPLYQMGNIDNDFNTGFHGKFLEQIGQLNNLQYLNLDQNSFSGRIAASINNLRQLGEQIYIMYLNSCHRIFD